MRGGCVLTLIVVFHRVEWYSTIAIPSKRGGNTPRTRNTSRGKGPSDPAAATQWTTCCYVAMQRATAQNTFEKITIKPEQIVNKTTHGLNASKETCFEFIRFLAK